MNKIKPEQLNQKNQDSVKLIDVRSPAEFRARHIEWAENIPLASLDEDALTTLKNEQQEICIMCKSGGRSSQAYAQLEAAGIRSLLILDGGLDQWDEQGLSVKEGKKSISIQRQVQITAGTLILMGVIVGFSLSEIGFIVSGAIGAGLLFAGLSNTCMLAGLLAKMPWNQ